MKVVLLTYVKGLGQSGQVVNVGDAYARNFLFPKKMATLATPDRLAQAKQSADLKSRQSDQRQHEEKESIERLNGATIRCVRPGVPGKHLYVSLKLTDIAVEVRRAYGCAIDRATMDPAVIKATGPTITTLTWPDRKTTTFTVVVEAAGEPIRR